MREHGPELHRLQREQHRTVPLRERDELQPEERHREQQVTRAPRACGARAAPPSLRSLTRRPIGGSPSATLFRIPLSPRDEACLDYAKSPGRCKRHAAQQPECRARSPGRAFYFVRWCRRIVRHAMAPRRDRRPRRAPAARGPTRVPVADTGRRRRRRRHRPRDEPLVPAPSSAATSSASARSRRRPTSRTTRPCTSRARRCADDPSATASPSGTTPFSTAAPSATAA